MKEHEKSGKIIAAICAGKVIIINVIILFLLIVSIFAAPFVLFKHGIAQGKTLTSYPTVKSSIEGSYQYKEDSTIVDGKKQFLI